MIDNPFRAVLPRFTRPLLRMYSFLRVTPNQLTTMALIFSLTTFVAIVRGQFVFAVLTWWLGRLLDGTDGIYARATGQTSMFGAHIDILADMASYSLVVLALNHAYPQYQQYWITMLFFYVLCITGALSLGILEKENGVPSQDQRGLRLGAGLAEGGETGIAYTVFLLFPRTLPYSLWAWIAVLAVTVAARLILARRLLRL